jgi:hypothetical protein
MGRVHIQDEPPLPGPQVRGLVLPALLTGLLACGRWQHPGDEVLRAALSWFEEPVNFLSSPGAMEGGSRSLTSSTSAPAPPCAAHSTPSSAATA